MPTVSMCLTEKTFRLNNQVLNELSNSLVLSDTASFWNYGLELAGGVVRRELGDGLVELEPHGLSMMIPVSKDNTTQQTNTLQYSSVESSRIPACTDLNKDPARRKPDLTLPERV